MFLAFRIVFVPLFSVGTTNRSWVQSLGRYKSWAARESIHISVRSVFVGHDRKWLYWLATTRLLTFTVGYCKVGVLASAVAVLGTREIALLVGFGEEFQRDSYGTDEPVCGVLKGGAGEEKWIC